MTAYVYELLSLGQWNLSYMSWVLFYLAAFIAGFSKSGLPGITIVTVPLMAMALPPKTSVGLMLTLYLAADVISVYKYWRFARRRTCLPYLIFVAMGVCGASLIVDRVDNKMFGVIIGLTVLVLIFISIATNRARKRQSLQIEEAPPGQDVPSLACSVFFGLTAGLFSALANAAAPIVTLYMIASRLDKFQLIGTTAVCAIFMNSFKVPLFISKGMLNADVLKLGAAALPVVALGCAAGIVFAKKLPQKAFKNTVLVLAFLASVKLILG